MRLNRRGRRFSTGDVERHDDDPRRVRSQRSQQKAHLWDSKKQLRIVVSSCQQNTNEYVRCERYERYERRTKSKIRLERRS
jgi:hypothetical protein